MATALSFDILARDRASATLSKVGKSAETTGRRFDKFRAIAAGAGIAAGAALIKFGKDSVKAYSEAQQSQTQLEDAFKRFPKLANANIDSFRALNTALAQKTRFDDDAYASGQAILAQFRLTGDEIKNVTPLLGDYAAKTGRDIPTAAKLLGKASLGNTRALKELGINFKATGDQGKDMATVVALLQQRVGGFAAKEGKTAAGQAAILSNQFGELEETVGSKLVPALLKLTEVGLKAIAFFQRYSDVLVPVTAGILAFVVATKAARTAQLLLNAAVLANPYVAAAAAIIALGVAVYAAYRRFKAFRDIVNATAKEIANRFLDSVETIISLTDRLVGVFAKLPGPLGAPWRAMRDDVHNALIEVHNLQGAINAIHSKTVSVTVNTNFIGGTSGGRGGGRRQHGGPVADDQAYLVGEDGPEVLYQGRVYPRGQIPPALRPAGEPAAGGMLFTGDIHLHGIQDMNQLVAQLQRYAKRNGGIKIRTFA